MSEEKIGQFERVVLVQGNISFGEVPGFEGYAVTFDTDTLLYYLLRASRNKNRRCKVGPVVVEVTKPAIGGRR